MSLSKTLVPRLSVCERRTTVLFAFWIAAARTENNLIRNFEKMSPTFRRNSPPLSLSGRSESDLLGREVPSFAADLRSCYEHSLLPHWPRYFREKGGQVKEGCERQRAGKAGASVWNERRELRTAGSSTRVRGIRRRWLHREQAAADVTRYRDGYSDEVSSIWRLEKGGGYDRRWILDFMCAPSSQLISSIAPSVGSEIWRKLTVCFLDFEGRSGACTR